MAEANARSDGVERCRERSQDDDRCLAPSGAPQTLVLEALPLSRALLQKSRLGAGPALVLSSQDCQVRQRHSRPSSAFRAAWASRMANPSSASRLEALAETREEREEQLIGEALRDSLQVARRIDLDEVETDDLLAAAEVEERIHCLPRC